MTRERIIWIDQAKAFAIIGVFVCHQIIALQGVVSEEVKGLFKYWMLALFFFSSGYLHKKYYGLKNEVKRILFRLLLPYLIYVLIFYFIASLNFWKALCTCDWGVVIDKLIPFAKGRIIWFIPCCVVLELFVILIHEICRLFSVKADYALICVGVLSFVGCFFAVPDNEAFWFYDRAFFALGFYISGIYFRRFEFKFPYLEKRYIAISSFMLYLVAMVLAEIFGVKYDLHRNIFNPTLVALSISVLGCVSIISMSKSFFWGKWISFIGANTLIFFLLSSKTLMLGRMSVMLICGEIDNSLSAGFSVALALLLTSLAAVILNKVFPLITGKYRPKNWSKT